MGHKPSVFGARRPAPASHRELEVRAQALCGARVGTLAQALGVPLPHNPRHAKGFVGQLVECALGADPKALDRPDFPELGVELKTVPVNPAGKPTESTFCCSIHMASADVQTWEASRLRTRLAHVLWVPVSGAKVAELPERRFGLARLWRLGGDIEATLRQDWEDLMGRIGAGLCDDLSAHAGAILQVRPKAAHAGVRTLAPGPGGLMQTLPLGFYLRPSFTARILSS